MSYIQFSTNWNNKLDCKVFTTIRKECYVNIGEVIDIKLKQSATVVTTIGRAKVLAIEKMRACDIPVQTICTDVGYPYDESLKVLVSMLGSLETECYVITLQSFK